MEQQAQVRNTQVEDIPALIALQTKIYPDIPPWEPEEMERQIRIFPQGQLVVELDGAIVGCASSLVVVWDEWAEAHTWKEITSNGTFKTHTPEGKTLYGAEVFVDPDVQGSGVGHLLYEARREICRQMNLKRIIACGRLPGYHQHATQMTAEFYAQKVVWGDFKDPVLSFQIREGFSYCGIIEGYIPEDTESDGNAAIIVWLNPDYDDSQLPQLDQDIDMPN